MVFRTPGRSSLSLGIFVEGASDRQTIPILLRKLGQRGIHSREVESEEMLDADAMVPHIEALTRAHSRLTKILIFRDSEGVDPAETFKRTRRPERKLNSAFTRPPIRYVIVDRSIEGWLACDQNAVRHVMGGRKRINLINDPESHLRPASLLQQVFRVNGKEFKKTIHNQAIAELADPKMIAQRSTTFRRLIALLRRL